MDMDAHRQELAAIVADPAVMRFIGNGGPVERDVAWRLMAFHLGEWALRGRGNWAALYDKERDRTYVYMHMLEPASVKAGQKLDGGGKVGLLGCTGSCDGAHLHFEIRAGADPYGAPSDPLAELKRWETLPSG